MNERIAESWIAPGTRRIVLEIEAIRYSGCDASCAGRRCLNPEHYGEEVIDVEAVPERKAITDGGE